MRRAGGPQPRVEGVRIFLVGDSRIEVGAAAEPAFRRRQEARVHVDGRDVRIGHVRDEADPGREEARVGLRPVDAGGELGREAAADRRDVDSDLLEHLAVHLPANAPAAGSSLGVGPFPGRIGEARVAARFALNRFEFRTDAVSKGFEPVARGLLLFVEWKHGAGL